MKKFTSYNSNKCNTLDKQTKIKIWIKTLLNSYRVFPNLINTIDKIINLQASSMSFTSNIYNSSKGTELLIERVIDMSERKKSLVNIYLMISKFLDSLSLESRDLVEKKYIDKLTNEELSLEYDISTRTIYRRLNKIIDELYSYFVRMRWSIEFIESQVENEDWLIDKYNYYKNDYLSSMKSTTREDCQSKSSSESYDGNAG